MRETQSIAALEQKRANFYKDVLTEQEDPYPMYGRTYHGYEYSDIEYSGRGRLVPGFRQLLSEFNRPVYVFEPFGPLTMIESLHQDGLIAGGLAMTRVEYRDDTKKSQDADNNLEMIAQKDFFEFKQWQADIDRYLSTHNLDGFQLIVVSPGLGWRLQRGKPPHGFNNIPIKLKWLVVNRLWQLLDPDKGIIVVDFFLTRSRYLEDRLTNDALKNWESKINGLKTTKPNYGINAEYNSRGVLTLRKNSAYPKTLPPMPDIAKIYSE